MTMARLGLVTVLYNSDEVLEGFIKSVSGQQFTNYILLLVDNSANEKTDILLEQLLTRYPVNAYRHIKSSGNIGVAAGNNAGIRAALAANCSELILLNNDIEMEQPTVFGDMLAVSAERGGVMVVPKILYYDTRKIWMAGGYMDNFRALGVHYGINKTDEACYNKAKYITYAPTCFMLIPATVLDKIGLMDEKYFAYCDDTDFVYRALKNNCKLFYQPSVSILHKVSSSSGGDSSFFYIYYSNRNKIYFIKKNYKGVHCFFSLCYMLASRVFFYLRFDSARKKKLMQAIKDGFALSLKGG
jgi:GT2 family glycosyltransferase